jgi:hypothetical protein
VPLDDPRQVRSLDDAFDLTTPEIQLWELHLIWRALAIGHVDFSPHARRAALDESIPRIGIERVITGGTPRSKDVRLDGPRRVGINFEGKIASGRQIRVKVSWLGGYVVATVHTL